MWGEGLVHWDYPEGWDGGSGWGTHVNPWLIHVNLWQKPLQYCKVISLQLIKINGKKKKTVGRKPAFPCRCASAGRRWGQLKYDLWSPPLLKGRSADGLWEGGGVQVG